MCIITSICIFFSGNIVKYVQLIHWERDWVKNIEEISLSFGSPFVLPIYYYHVHTLFS